MTAIFRPMVDSDRDFVISGWSSSFRNSKFAGPISMVRWADAMHDEIEHRLRRPSTRVIVAEEPGEIVETADGPRAWLYGFIAIRIDLDTPYVYYVYVKSRFRRGRARLGLEHGYATQLFAAAAIDPDGRWLYDGRTSASEALAAKFPRAQWDPLPARYEEPNDRDQEASRGARSQGRYPDPPRSFSRRR